jgi:hypothetical protein
MQYENRGNGLLRPMTESSQADRQTQARPPEGTLRQHGTVRSWTAPEGQVDPRSILRRPATGGGFGSSKVPMGRGHRPGRY